MARSSSLPVGLWRDRLMIGGTLAAVTILAWTYLTGMAGTASEVSAQTATAQMEGWDLADMGFVFAMWCGMAVGMMLPSASPMVLTFSAICRRRDLRDTWRRTALFVGGYLIIWIGYSALATGAQAIFHSAAILSAGGAIASPYLSGGLLLMAGVFQFTRLKYACLDHCRSPMGFLVGEWRSGRRGALLMGLRHGGNCATCCWAIMALMFVLGVMNLLWMAALTVLCLIEKLGPAPRLVGRVTGGLFIGWGGCLIAAALL